MPVKTQTMCEGRTIIYEIANVQFAHDILTKASQCLILTKRNTTTATFITINGQDIRVMPKGLVATDEGIEFIRKALNHPRVRITHTDYLLSKSLDGVIDQSTQKYIMYQKKKKERDAEFEKRLSEAI